MFPYLEQAQVILLIFELLKSHGDKPVLSFLLFKFYYFLRLGNAFKNAGCLASNFGLRGGCLGLP